MKHKRKRWEVVAGEQVPAGCVEELRGHQADETINAYFRPHFPQLPGSKFSWPYQGGNVISIQITYGVRRGPHKYADMPVTCREMLFSCHLNVYVCARV